MKNFHYVIGGGEARNRRKKREGEELFVHASFGIPRSCDLDGGIKVTIPKSAISLWTDFPKIPPDVASDMRFSLNISSSIVYS